MHGDVVPTEVEFAASKGPIRPLPERKDLVKNNRQDAVEIRKTGPQQCPEIDTFSVVVQLPPVYD